MDRRAFIGTVAGGLLAAPLAAGAQPAGKVYRIGVLSTGGREQGNFIWADLRGQLRERGWVEMANASDASWRLLQLVQRPTGVVLS